MNKFINLETTVTLDTVYKRKYFEQYEFMTIVIVFQDDTTFFNEILLITYKVLQ